MKKLSIKLNVTLWFTGLLTLLAAIILVALFSVSKRLTFTTVSRQLSDAVEVSQTYIEVEDGVLEFNRRFKGYADGIYLSVYTVDGGFLYGEQPRTFTTAVPLSQNLPQQIASDTGTWYLYDSLYTVDSENQVWIRGIISGAQATGTFTAMLQTALYVLPLLILVAALGGYWITHRAFRPVRIITDAASQISNGNDLSRRINLGQGKDEIYTLANTFDQMFDRLDHSFEKEKQFTSDVSHELRTPTAVIISQCEYALAHGSTLEETKEALEHILEQAQSMSSLVTQLLTLSRADRGQLSLQKESLNFSELTEMVCLSVQESAAQRGITLHQDIVPDLWIDGDETLLMRLWMNLMTNGIYYGKPNGNLWIELSRQGTNLVGILRDDGIGIAPEHLSHIWDRFFQADPTRSSQNQGMGLGLSMVQWIVQAHGGTIAVESLLKLGTTFTFTLPEKSEENKEN